jgi:hypothetical protein
MPTRRRPPVVVRILVVAGALAGLGYLIYARTRPDVPATVLRSIDPRAGSAGSGSSIPPHDRHFYGSKYMGNAR